MNNPSELRKKMLEDHSLLREKLESKGYLIVDEFNCAGYNTNSFLRFFGGSNKGRSSNGCRRICESAEPHQRDQYQKCRLGVETKDGEHQGTRPPGGRVSENQDIRFTL